MQKIKTAQRFKTLEEKIKIVDELFSGKTLSELSGEYDISERSIFTWSQNYDKMKTMFEVQQQEKSIKKTIEKEDVEMSTINALIKSNLNLTNSIQKLVIQICKK